MAPHTPLVLAKMLASIDLFSGGRVIVGAAGGYMEREFNALGVPFTERGARTDEAVRMLRALWTQDPVTETFPVHGVVFDDMRVKPQPGRHVPIWIGGHSAPALRRAVQVGDGWHGVVQSATVDGLTEVEARVRLLRHTRPDSDFVLSVRAFWDGIEDDPDELLRCLEVLHRLGVSHVVAEPRQRDLDGYLRSMERLAEVFARAGIPMAV